MIETFIAHNKLFTSRTNLLNWEYNLKTINSEKYQALLQARKDYIDVSSLLVMPDGLIIGGNSRNEVGAEAGIADEWIEIIDFLQHTDGRWYVAEFYMPDPTPVIRFDKKSFPTKDEGMQRYSLLHNAQFAGIDPEKLSMWEGSPLLPEMNWDEFYNVVGDIKSIGGWMDKIETPAVNDNPINSGQSVSSEGSAEPSPDPVKSEEVSREKSEEAIPAGDYIEVESKCPDCGCKFYTKVLKSSIVLS